MESKIFAIPQEIMIGPGEELFNHIAECIAQFIEENELHGETLPLGKNRYLLMVLAKRKCFNISF